MSTCSFCDGEGVVLVCVDDICRGQKHCIHGDGEVVCPECHGTAEYDEEDWEDDSD